jgi:hypothetical protein
MDNTPSSLKLVTRVHYPRQIKLSSDFLSALKKEYCKLSSMSTEEGPSPIRNCKTKFIKAINFILSQS